MFFYYFCKSRKKASGDSLHGSLSCLASMYVGAIFLVLMVPSEPSRKKGLVFRQTDVSDKAAKNPHLDK